MDNIITNNFIALIANFSFITHCNKCLNIVDNFIFTIYLLLLIIKTLYFLNKFLNLKYINKYIFKINFMTNLIFMSIITYYYIKEYKHEYKQFALFIWEWCMQLIFLLIYIEEKQILKKIS